MNALQRNDMGADAVLANDRTVAVRNSYASDLNQMRSPAFANAASGQLANDV
jgi:hypothetical protein